MILEKHPLTMAEVKEHIKSIEEGSTIREYLKKFTKISNEKSNEIKKKIISLNNPKIKETAIVKIVDTLPQDNEELNKIFTEVNLSEEETNAILQITKEY